MDALNPADDSAERTEKAARHTVQEEHRPFAEPSGWASP